MFIESKHKLFSHSYQLYKEPCGLLNMSMNPSPKRLGVLLYVGSINMCGPKVYGFSAVLVINRDSILAILVSNRVCFFFTLVFNWV